jgi:hypothetical protein
VLAAQPVTNHKENDMAAGATIGLIIVVAIGIVRRAIKKDSQA